MYSIVEVEYFLYGPSKDTSRWVKELRFFHGDLTDVDFENDWRFRKVEGKRNLARFLGTKKDLKFPIELSDYPLLLDNGINIEKYEEIKYKEE